MNDFRIRRAGTNTPDTFGEQNVWDSHLPPVLQWLLTISEVVKICLGDDYAKEVAPYEDHIIGVHKGEGCSFLGAYNKILGLMIVGCASDMQLHTLTAVAMDLAEEEDDILNPDAVDYGLDVDNVKKISFDKPIDLDISNKQWKKAVKKAKRQGKKREQRRARLAVKEKRDKEASDG